MKTSVALLIPAFLLGGVACDVTTEVTKAPFDLTSTIVKPTSEFTSSTSPGANSFTDPAKARRQLETFAAYSYDDIRADIARGNGEYLTSVATLAGVPAASHEAFHVDMQRNYGAMYHPGLSTKEAWVRVVETAWSAGHGH
jgi:hypothetical protein